jgi:hypothetical protein
VREVAEFRVAEELASMLFADDEGERLSSSLFRKVELDVKDPRFEQVGRLQRELHATKGKSFFFGWNITRHPSRQEFEDAALFLLKITAVFEPAGEEHGTEYDERFACPHCGAGARQVGPLSLPVSRIPRGKDIAATIAGEIVISRRLAEILKLHETSGIVLTPLLTDTKPRVESTDWFQLSVTHSTAEITPPTQVGVNPFNADPEGECRCPLGDLAGLNLLSAVSISAASRGGADFVCSHQFIGMRGGLLRPQRLILVSPKVGRLIKSDKIRGCQLEVAYLV